MSGSQAICVLSDIHGHDQVLLRLLRDTGLTDEANTWRGGSSILWLLGDFVDQGPHGIAVIELIMRLQEEAAAAGGAVRALLGNHDLLLLAAWRFGEHAIPAGGNFLAQWRQNGGRQTDLEALTAAHARWLCTLPMLAHVDGRLVAHADATFYRDYGISVAQVNAAVRSLLAGDDIGAWARLSAAFSRHREFAGDQGAARLDALLQRFGGAQLIHGHTPIVKHPASHPKGTAAPPPETVTAPLVYADGRCVDIDGGIYLGGPGFVYCMPPLDTASARDRSQPR
ncbi:MAG TPA: metallophosphoesterase [Chloroflexota bacterium]|nr:metallophosphoesterase [Chloroflexota bacterium]